MAATTTAQIADVQIRELTRHEDSRGGFTETYRTEWFSGPTMVQGNRSDSKKGVIRGLHFHRKQADYWVCLSGRILVCLYDMRKGSPTQSQTQTIILEGDSSLGIYIPPGVAHGFGALEDSTLTYLVDNYYDGADEFGVRYDDPDIACDWQIDDPILSPRDVDAPFVADIAEADLPIYSS